MKKEVKSDPPDDIPAWFMTYSDVITLLMTFFILLLTFSTTEPERFEKVQTSVHNAGAATGLVGKKIEGLTQDSWVTRIRPPAARIATRGAEMPPLTEMPVRKTFGQGLSTISEEDHSRNESTSHYFDFKLESLFTLEDQLSGQGRHVCQMLAGQLRDLPFHASIQFADPEDSARIAKMMKFIFDQRTSRPGQISMNLSRELDLKRGHVRVEITKFEVEPQ